MFKSSRRLTVLAGFALCTLLLAGSAAWLPSAAHRPNPQAPAVPRVAAAVVNIPAQARQGGEIQFTVNMSGTFNDVFVGREAYSVLAFVDVSDPDKLVLVATLPDPAAIFPKVPISLADWQKVHVPILDYYFAICWLACQIDEPGCPFRLCDPPPDASPEGMDEVFAAAFDNGDILEGITDFRFQDDVINYQINARFQPSAPVSSIQGSFIFPATEPLEPIRAFGTMTSVLEDGSVSDMNFDGLVLLKNRDGRLASPFRMDVEWIFSGLELVLVADLIPIDDNEVCICHIPPGNPDNAHTICIGLEAVPAHLGHGDSMDPCDNGSVR